MPTRPMSCSNAPRRRWLAPVLAISLAALIASGCGSDAANTTEPESPGADQPVDGNPGGSTGVDGPDLAAQPLDAIVAAVVAPTGGTDSRYLVQATVWAGGVLEERCGMVSFMRDGDRYDQATFADLDRIRTDGIGLADSFDHPIEDTPIPLRDAPDPGCASDVFPEWGDGQAVFGQWMDTVVLPRWQATERQEAATEVVDCLNGELSGQVVPFSSLGEFFGGLTGTATQWSQLPEADQRTKIEALDATATEAFLGCAEDFYTSWQDELTDARTEFLEQHGETVDALAAAMDRLGYVP